MATGKINKKTKFYLGESPTEMKLVETTAIISLKEFIVDIDT